MNMAGLTVRDRNSPRRRRRLPAVATVAVILLSATGANPTPAAAHDCGSQDPKCVDYGSMYQQKAAQYIRSRTLAHHCEDDKETIKSRLEVTFRDVTSHSAYLHKITVYFDGEHAYHLGALDAYGPDNEYHYQDHNTDWPPGSTLSLYPDKEVELSNGGFVVQHKPWRGMIGGSPGRGGAIIPCQGHPHQFLIRVRERQPRDPCRDTRPPGPC